MPLRKFDLFEECRFVPGYVQQLQTHGAGRLIYVIDGPYRATWKMPNGHTMRVVHETGDTYWFPGGTILVTNVGQNTVRVLAVIPNR